MLTTKRKPATVGEILVAEFMRPLGPDARCAWPRPWACRASTSISSAMIDEAVTAPTALILARVFGNSPDFWLNVQRRTDLWEALHSPRELARIERAKPLPSAA